MIADLKSEFKIAFCLVGWGFRIHRLHLCGGVRPFYECPGYETERSDGEVPMMQELFEMRSTPSLSPVLGPLWSGMVAHARVLSMCQIEINCVLMLNCIVRNRTVFYIETLLMLN